MATLIERKQSLAKKRVEFIEKILVELTASNSTFASSRKLSEYVAQKMTEYGMPVDSSTLRRSGSRYKVLIDNFVGKKKEKPDAKVRLELKIRQQKLDIERLTSRVDELEHEVDGKENEIRLLLVEAQDKRNSVIASIAPPKATTYTQSELATIKQLHESDKAQLSKALEVIENLLKPELRTAQNTEGSFVVKNGKVIDLLTDSELFNLENLPDYFKDK
ncbi:hypothetical protein [Vibrio agarilyticus]|uniref:hypothetical protein n=1 Tax=Vibrio agarilyticus TaxID=2726741 RepID=UPI001FE2B8E4|nr:hypothetical protein [Vibrio agarilyticus]